MQASQKEETYSEQIRVLTAKHKEVKLTIFSGLKVTFKINPKNLILNLKKKIQKKNYQLYSEKKMFRILERKKKNSEVWKKKDNVILNKNYEFNFKNWPKNTNLILKKDW